VQCRDCGKQVYLGKFSFMSMLILGTATRALYD